MSGGDPRAPCHENPRAGVLGGLDAEPRQDHVSLAGPCATVEKVPA